ncbi:hypothetical protein D3C73_959110 [compost metagenome]
MNRKKGLKPVGLIAATVLLGLMTGCGGLGENAEQAINSSARTIENAVSEVAKSSKEIVKENGYAKEVTTEEEVGTATTLHMNNAVGDIDIRSVSGTKITAKSTITASTSLFRSKKQLQKVIEQAEVSVVIEGDKVRVFTHAKDHPEQDLWDWSESKYGYSDFSIDYEIGLPSNVKVLDVTNDVGEIALADITGEYRIQSDVGSIEIKGAHFSGDSSLSSSTGSIDLEIGQIDSDGSLKAVADVGSIDLKLADAVSCILDLDADVGVINGASRGESKRGDGGPRVSLTTSVGAINVE